MTSRAPLVMILNGEQDALDELRRFVEAAGCRTIACPDGRDALALLQTRRVDLVLLDRGQGDVAGVDVLRAIRDVEPGCQVVVLNADTSLEPALDAIKLGASDVLTGPINFARLEALLTSVREDFERSRYLLTLESEVARRLEYCGMIGRGPAMQTLFGMIRRLAPHVRTTLITGEAGTGKELVARALHRLGPRRDQPFVAVGCAGAVETLFERTGAGRVPDASATVTEYSPAFLERADGGTLFLDEIGDLAPHLQATLLRVLDRGELFRAGGAEPIRPDVHLIASTSRDLRGEVARGRFGRDLFHRLSIVDVAVPPLRDRREDLPYLTAAFIRDATLRLQKPVVGLTAGAERLLADARWDGNVRQLRSVIDRACLLAHEELITERELRLCMPAAAAPADLETPGDLRPSDDLLVTVEREHIQRALLRTHGNKKAAARMLGLSRRALYRRLERLDLADTIMRRREPGPEAVGL